MPIDERYHNERDVRLRQQLQLYFIMGSANCSADPEQVLAEAIAGGITIFQYREKGRGALAGEAALELGRRLRQLCRQSAIPFIVNDDIDMALALEADGVHVGQEDAAAADVRRRIGADKLLGVSAHTVAEAEAAIAAGADYIGVGPIYATATKEDAKPAVGASFIHALRLHGIDVPMVGIGGIDAGNAREVMRAGADGVSLISAISMAPSPRASAAQLRAIVGAAQ